MSTFKGPRRIYSTPSTCTLDSTILLITALERIDPCFECNANRVVCHGRDYSQSYRFDINGEWKPFTPIKLPHNIFLDPHPDALYIPKLDYQKDECDYLTQASERMERYKADEDHALDLAASIGNDEYNHLQATITNSFIRDSIALKEQYPHVVERLID